MNLSNYGIAEGRLAKDVTVMTNRDGSKKALLTLAVHNNYKSKASGKREAQFIPMEGFIPAGITGNGVYDLIHKGDAVTVAYELKNDSFVMNGTSQYKLIVRINQIKLMESKSVTDARLARRVKETIVLCPENGGDGYE